ncbi:hypothetical protein HQ587_07170 [bacterium]|nr:hypothetical protein [bacterium]
MPLRCKCGSTHFKPIGIQESWSGKKTNHSQQVLFLVNCLKCGTTISCNRLDYALMRNEEADAALEVSFFTSG